MNAVEMVPRKGCYITNLGEEKVRPEKEVLYNAWTEEVKGLEQYKKEVEEFVMTVILTNEEKRAGVIFSSFFHLSLFVAAEVKGLGATL